MNLISVSRAVTQEDIHAWGAHPPPVALETLSGAPIAVGNIAVDDRLVWIAGEPGLTPRRVLLRRAESSTIASWPPGPTLYAEGSAACRNYSTLTKDLRLLAGQLLVAYAVATAFYMKEIPANAAGVATAGIAVSLVLMLFAAALWRVNLHYGSAFLAIRDCLARIENGRDGPWTAHKAVRRWPRDEWAYAAPFIALAGAATLGGIGAASWHLGWCGFLGGALLACVFWLYEIRHGTRSLRITRVAVLRRAKAVVRSSR